MEDLACPDWCSRTARATAPALWLCGPGRAIIPPHDPGNRTGDPGRPSGPGVCRGGHQVYCFPTGIRLGRHTKNRKMKPKWKTEHRCLGNRHFHGGLVTRSLNSDDENTLLALNKQPITFKLTVFVSVFCHDCTPEECVCVCGGVLVYRV